MLALPFPVPFRLAIEPRALAGFDSLCLVGWNEFGGVEEWSGVEMHIEVWVSVRV